MHLQYVVIILILVFNTEIESAFSATNTARRTQSMRLFSRTQTSAASSSASSTASLRNGEPLATTSFAENPGFTEIELKPITVDMKRADVIKSENFNEAEVSSGSRLNPLRDGPHARVSRIIIQQGVSAVVGAATGVGAFALANEIKQMNISLASTTSTTSATVENSTRQKIRNSEEIDLI